jgi:hypothetical protein
MWYYSNINAQARQHLTGSIEEKNTSKDLHRNETCYQGHEAGSDENGYDFSSQRYLVL